MDDGSVPRIQTQPRLGRLLLIIAGFSVVVVLTLQWRDIVAQLTQSSGAGQPAANLSVAALDTERSLGMVTYVARRDDVTGAINASAKIDTSSAQAIEAYAAWNRAEALKLANEGGEIPINISFRKLIDGKEYLNWVAANSVYVEVTAYRGLGPTSRSAGGVRGLNGDPTGYFNRAYIEDLSFVYGVGGKVKAEQLRSIVNDPLVFLVDVTEVLVRRDLAAVGIKLDSYGGVSALWEMEDYNMMEHWQDGKAVLPMPSAVATGLPAAVATQEP